MYSTLSASNIIHLPLTLLKSLIYFTAYRCKSLREIGRPGPQNLATNDRSGNYWEEDQLSETFEKLWQGINNVPALLQPDPETLLDNLHLDRYEICPSEPLHG